MSEFLIVILDHSKPGLVIAPCNQDEFVWSGRKLIDTGIRTIVGFFDWLRTDENEVIGVRLTILDEELDYLVPELARPDYVEELPRSVGIEIFFSEERNYNDRNSDDQDFMDNWIYRSDDGTYAISFNAQYSIDSLKSNPAVQLAEQ